MAEFPILSNAAGSVAPLLGRPVKARDGGGRGDILFPVEGRGEDCSMDESNGGMSSGAVGITVKISSPSIESSAMFNSYLCVF